MDIDKKDKIIIFDGVCNLCNGAVTFIIKRDRKNLFKFATLQSEIAEELLIAKLPDINSLVPELDPSKIVWSGDFSFPEMSDNDLIRLLKSRLW